MCQNHTELIRKCHLINKQVLLTYIAPGSATTLPTARHGAVCLETSSLTHMTSLVQPATNIGVQVQCSTLSWSSISRSRELQCTAQCEQGNTLTATEWEMLLSRHVGYWQNVPGSRFAQCRPSLNHLLLQCSISVLSNKRRPEYGGTSKNLSGEGKKVLPFYLKRELKWMIHVLLHWGKPSSEKHQGTLLHAVKKQDLV